MKCFFLGKYITLLEQIVYRPDVLPGPLTNALLVRLSGILPDPANDDTKAVIDAFCMTCQ